MSVEEEIIQLLSSAPKQAIPLIYDNYADSLYSVLLNILHDSEDAQDVLQRSFIKFWQKADSYDRTKARLFTWLLNIARNTAIDELRRRGRKVQREIRTELSDVYTIADSNVDPELVDMREHLTKLDDKQRLVIEALYFSGMTQSEAAEALNMPLGSVKTSLRLGLRELRKTYGVPSMWLLFALSLLK